MTLEHIEIYSLKIPKTIKFSLSDSFSKKNTLYVLGNNTTRIRNKLDIIDKYDALNIKQIRSFLKITLLTSRKLKPNFYNLCPKKSSYKLKSDFSLLTCYTFFYQLYQELFGVQNVFFFCEISKRWQIVHEEIQISCH